MLQGLVVVPFLLVGATDSRHYPDITAGGTHVYRFNALKASLKQKDISRVHGIDERIEVGCGRCAAGYSSTSSN